MTLQQMKMMMGDDGSPFINLFSRNTPFIYHAEPSEQRVMGLYGAGSDSPSILGKYNGYVNISDTDPTVFPWTLTLSDGVIHYDPRLDFLHSEWWVRAEMFDTVGVTPSITGTTFNTFTKNFGVVIAMTGNDLASGGTVRFDWSDDGGESGIQATGWYRFDSDIP